MFTVQFSFSPLFSLSIRYIFVRKERKKERKKEIIAVFGCILFIKAKGTPL